MIYIIFGLILTTYLQVIFAKKRLLILGILMPLFFAIFHALTEAVVYNSPLLVISFGILLYYLFVYFIAFAYFNKKNSKISDVKKMDIKDL
ncbi:MAG: hypothetical protein AB7U52_04775 [Candidatus Izemoplasmatales bacterium]